MSAEKPTVVIVPGSFSPTFMYDNIISQLSSHGYSALTVSLPSVGQQSDVAPATLADDAACVNSITSKLADEGKEIILAMHSYGGFPGTESARGLARADRQAKKLNGGIVRLVYFSAFLAEEGQSLRDVTGATAESVLTQDGYMIIDGQLRNLYAGLVYSDLSFEQGFDWIGKMKEHSSVSFDGKLTYPAYKYIPVTYLICEDDKVTTPELQRKMVETAKEQSKMDFDVVLCAAGHGVNISMPDAVVSAIEKAAGSEFLI